MCRRRCVGRGGLVDRMLWPLCAGKIKEVTTSRGGSVSSVLRPLSLCIISSVQPLGAKDARFTVRNVTRSPLSPRQNTMDGDHGTILPLSSTNHTLWDEAAAILSGLIGGGRYGLKIRVPHALGTS